MSKHYHLRRDESIAHFMAKLLQRKSKRVEQPRAEQVEACGKVNEAEASSKGLVVSETEDIFSERKLRAAENRRPKKMDKEIQRLRMEIMASGQRHDKALKEVQHYAEQIQKIVEAAQRKHSESNVRRLPEPFQVPLSTTAYEEKLTPSSCRTNLSTGGTALSPKGQNGPRMLEERGGAMPPLEEKDCIQEFEGEQMRVRTVLEEADVTVLEGHDLRNTVVAHLFGWKQQVQAHANEAVDMTLATREAEME